MTPEQGCTAWPDPHVAVPRAPTPAKKGQQNSSAADAAFAAACKPDMRCRACCPNFVRAECAHKLRTAVGRACALDQDKKAMAFGGCVRH
mmetsp:Transcript_115934/g.374573  ORF Transcript_115934/g.374573 Transcript_115934/m.374573 type:complete len:90 (+) Transcript_115934:237-506(+)